MKKIHNLRTIISCRFNDFDVIRVKRSERYYGNDQRKIFRILRKGKGKGLIRDCEGRGREKARRLQRRNQRYSKISKKQFKKQTQQKPRKCQKPQKTKKISKQKSKQTLTPQTLSHHPSIPNPTKFPLSYPPTLKQSLINSPSYIVCDENLSILASRKQHYLRPIASITKLINLLTCLDVMKEFNITMDHLCQIPKLNIKRSESSAKIIQGEKIKMRDLLYAMILPSGNDAAQAVAIILGRYLLRSKKKQDMEYKKAYLSRMSQQAKSLNMPTTHLLDQKGFANNTSTAYQISLLLHTLHTNQTAYPFLQKQSIHATITDPNNKIKGRSWTTTNSLFGYGYYGKTGHATDGSFNLAVIKKYEGKTYYICVLGSRSESGRFTDVLYLFNNVVKRGRRIG